MHHYRARLPQLGGELFLTDGGLETTLIFHEGWRLPYFAAFDLLESAAGRQALKRYFQSYAALAQRFGVGLILESATWRASPDWGARLRYRPLFLEEANRDAIQLLEEVRDEFASSSRELVISGCVGPRGDGYQCSAKMSADEAEAYHRTQIETLADTAADLVTAMTINDADEAVGIANAAQRAHVPVVISFTVETNGQLPTGQPLSVAIHQVDVATGAYPSYYMINCAHPRHFEAQLLEHKSASPTVPAGPTVPGGETWLQRIRGLRANASAKSHAELNESPELDQGDPVDFGQQHARLRACVPHLNVLGGCCGTDLRHIEQIAAACLVDRERSSGDDPPPVLFCSPTCSSDDVQRTGNPLQPRQ